MRKHIDLTGQRFGRLVTIEVVGKDKYYDKLWRCICDCGKETIVRQGHLRSGHSQSCGCMRPSLKSLVGERFGFLTVESRGEDYTTPRTNKRYVTWICRCDCGAMTQVLVNNLRSGSTISCGCQDPHRLDDLTGRRFGKLVVTRQIEPYINPRGRRLIRYECQCDCGNIMSALANALRVGDVRSCGCMVMSRGEEAVKQWLDQHHMLYRMYETFKGCQGVGNHPLSFDFYLESKGAVIECNGLQHYESIEFFGGDERLKIQQANDACKVKFAKTQQLRLLVLDCRKVNTKIIDQTLEQFLL